jgi:uncharacterized protein YdhG (YjbR/CyaY superfamily)
MLPNNSTKTKSPHGRRNSSTNKTASSGVDTYIKSFPKDVALKLQSIRGVIRKNAKDAEEVLSYQMPAYKLNGMLVYFAAFKNHIGFYPFSSAIKFFKKDLVKYKTSKGTVQFPLDRSLPLPLIRKIILFRVKENLNKKKK